MNPSVFQKDPPHNSGPLVKVSELGDSKSFGELAILTERPRAARIVAEELTYCAVLLRQDYFKVLGKIENLQKDSVIDFIQEMPVFQGFSRNNLRKFTGAVETLKVIKG